MEAFEIGDNVYLEGNNIVMEIISIEGDMVTCTWRDSTGGLLLQDKFPQSSLKKISIGGRSSTSDAFKDWSMKDAH